MSIGGLGGFGGAFPAQSQRLTFDKADSDQSGDINFDEFSSIGQKLPGGKSSLDKDALKSLFSAIDSDGNGAVSRTEAKTAYEKLSQGMQSQLLAAQEQASATAQASAQAQFQAADSDGSGGLSLDEFKASLAANAPEGAPAPSDSRLQSVFSGIDANGDGSISEEELKIASQSQAHHGHHDHAPRMGAEQALASQATSAYTQASATDVLNKLTSILTSV